MEWGFASNVPWIGGGGCYASFAVGYRDARDSVDLYGDTVVSFEGGDVFTGLELNAFHTYRYETPDGLNYCFFVDGNLFYCGSSLHYDLHHYVQMYGHGGCYLALQPTINRWDYVRYGRITEGETIGFSDPPGGVVNANLYPDLDRFTVTFDAPNYVFVDQIHVEISGESHLWSPRRFAPTTGRRRSWKSSLIVRCPWGTTRFTFDTGGEPQVVEYTYLTLGSCCPPDGSCLESDEGGCAALGGTFHSAASCIASQTCCFTDGTCKHFDPLCCVDLGGRSLGPDTVCEGDRDSDGADGLCGDDCPDDPQKKTPGACGCGHPDTDIDLDTIADCVDQCPGVDDRPDQDGDGIPDCVDFLPIPTTTTWGLVVLALLLLCAVKIMALSPSPIPRR